MNDSLVKQYGLWSPLPPAMTFDPTRRWYRSSLEELRTEGLAWADRVVEELWWGRVREEAQSAQPTMTLYELLDAGDLFLRHPERRWN